MAALSVVAVAGVVPVVAAGSAHATTAQCVNYLGSQGYAIGPRVGAACAFRHLTGPFDSKYPNPNCYSRLVAIGVTTSHAMNACLKA
ncbi:hypothetical protein GCM10017771_13350 [Streptomyces capitiformicae]|uniref:Secreted protein n=1 Tax=Streptomyces capitiformicae TaxID=2014920 RepID=A0A919L590_9ACTN|nr:hypothetical protein GCM10017771_13350 [Streptomyces capitiformicae]